MLDDAPRASPASLLRTAALRTANRQRKLFRSGLPWRLMASMCFHMLLLAGLVHVRAMRVAPVRLPGTPRGTRMLLTYAPGRAPAQAQSLKKTTLKATAKALPRLMAELPKPEPAAAATPSPASAHPDATSGNDALGTGDVNIALLTFFPTPKPDLTQLPHGTRGDVVIDVVIDANGKIVQMTMARGLGYGVDQAVIATVQQWTFHPATRNGHPVASEQELLFHYEHS